MTSVETLDPELRTIGELFGEDGAIYTIPAYQRNYAWKAEQIEQLIADISDAIDDDEDGYFLGNLIVTERNSETTDFEVIDGQQRLTTLYLLLTFLAETGGTTHHAPNGRLRYESRPRATEALQRIGTESSRNSAALSSSTASQDTGIHEGFNVIRQYIDQHIADGPARSAFAKFLRSRVTVVRASLPPRTDLNRYFEIMNTRGQQLQQVDIVKARLMSYLDVESERSCFAWIWEACSEMDSYVQMSLTRGDTSMRRAIFGEDWTWLTAEGFHALLRINESRASGTPGTDPPGKSLTLDDALAKYVGAGTPETTEDPDNVRFRSTIEFPMFLLHVLKVMNHDYAEEEGHLDDKGLIKRFDENVGSDKAQWVRNFAFQLLRCRNLFDGFILKRQYTATNGDDGDWSLQRLRRRERKTNNRATPGYINTFTRGIEIGRAHV